MGRGRRGGEEGGWKGVEEGGDNEEGGVEGGAVRDRPLQLPRVPLVGACSAPLAWRAMPDTARWPAPAIQALPPLALGGMGGDALITCKLLASLSFI
jgi:hypothetical protein